VAASEQQARALAESDRLKSALLSSVSHELRTPLATIKASVTSLLGGYDLDAAVQAELLAAIEEETDHLNQLVGNLLSMSRLEAGALQLQRRWNSLRDILDGVLQRMRLTAHKIEMQVSEDLPLLPVDYVLIEQVFTNLLSNCAKYAPENSLILIRAQAQEDQTLLVQFVNQGPPVAEEHLEHIFDKFYRITAAEKVSGIGLGLSICKGIVEIHGGRIWAENSTEGFTFNVSLPLTWQGEQPYLPNP
jgi:two-component system, OmpR family, sensor histidine kinase KdpD